MKLGEFIKSFTHNNLIRLLYKTESGHETVLDSWDIVSMDWEVNSRKGIYTKYVDNEVIGLVGVFGLKSYSEAINIVIKKN